MKQILLMIAVLALVGCGNKKPVQSTESKTETTKQEKGRGKAAEKTTPQGINQTSKVQIGTPIWEFKTGNYKTGNYVRSSPAIGSDGTVYVGSDNNKFYAIKTDSKGLAKSPWPMRGQNARRTGRVMKKE